MPRPDPAKRTPLWLQRLRAKDLLQVVRQFPDFPIVVETYRECLDDDLDLPRLRALPRRDRARDRSGSSRRAGEIPSPFASELIFRFTAALSLRVGRAETERPAAGPLGRRRRPARPAPARRDARRLARPAGDRPRREPPPADRPAAAHRGRDGRAPAPPRRPDAVGAGRADGRSWPSCTRPAGPSRSSSPARPSPCAGSRPRKSRASVSMRRFVPSPWEAGSIRGGVCEMTRDVRARSPYPSHLAEEASGYDRPPVPADARPDRPGRSDGALSDRPGRGGPTCSNVGRGRQGGPTRRHRTRPSETRWAERGNLAEMRRVTVAVRRRESAGGRPRGLRRLPAAPPACPSRDAGGGARRSSSRSWSSSKACAPPARSGKPGDPAAPGAAATARPGSTSVLGRGWLWRAETAPHGDARRGCLLPPRLRRARPTDQQEPTASLGREGPGARALERHGASFATDLARGLGHRAVAGARAL